MADKDRLSFEVHAMVIEVLHQLDAAVGGASATSGTLQAIQDKIDSANIDTGTLAYMAESKFETPEPEPEPTPGTV